MVASASATASRALTRSSHTRPEHSNSRLACRGSSTWVRVWVNCEGER